VYRKPYKNITTGKKNQRSSIISRQYRKFSAFLGSNSQLADN
jgi:hypothetical protein